jgi:hypothetical protein
METWFQFSQRTLGDQLLFAPTREERAFNARCEQARIDRAARIARENAGLRPEAREVHEKWDREWKLAVAEFERRERFRPKRSR